MLSLPSSHVPAPQEKDWTPTTAGETQEVSLPGSVGSVGSDSSPSRSSRGRWRPLFRDPSFGGEIGGEIGAAKGRPTLKTQRSFVFEDEAELLLSKSAERTETVAKGICSQRLDAVWKIVVQHKDSPEASDAGDQASQDLQKWTPPSHAPLRKISRISSCSAFSNVSSSSGLPGRSISKESFLRQTSKSSGMLPISLPTMLPTPLELDLVPLCQAVFRSEDSQGTSNGKRSPLLSPKTQMASPTPKAPQSPKSPGAARSLSKSLHPMFRAKTEKFASERARSKELQNLALPKLKAGRTCPLDEKLSKGSNLRANSKNSQAAGLDDESFLD